MSAVPKNLRAFANMLESVNDAIAILDKVETLSQFERETDARVEASRKLMAEMDAKIAAAAVSADETIGAAKAILKAAEDDADLLIAEAKLAAQAVAVKAEKDADKLKADTAKKLVDAEARVKLLEAHAEDLAEQCAASEAKLAELAGLKAAIAKIAGV